jgi:hypothetical protein
MPKGGDGNLSGGFNFKFFKKGGGLNEDEKTSRKFHN